jgi:hypothetical protein
MTFKVLNSSVSVYSSDLTEGHQASSTMRSISSAALVQRAIKPNFESHTFSVAVIQPVNDCQ